MRGDLGPAVAPGLTGKEELNFFNNKLNEFT
jgi:hypothetical protein